MPNLHTTFTKYGINFYADAEEIEQHDTEVQKIITELNEALSKHETFQKIDFCDVSAGGIQIRLFTKAEPGCSIGEQQTILHDWSNVDEVIANTIAEYERVDTPERIQQFKEFMEFGRKYGWD